MRIRGASSRCLEVRLDITSCGSRLLDSGAVLGACFSEESRRHAACLLSGAFVWKLMQLRLQHIDQHILLMVPLGRLGRNRQQHIGGSIGKIIRRHRRDSDEATVLVGTMLQAGIAGIVGEACGMRVFGERAATLQMASLARCSGCPGRPAVQRCARR